MRTHIKIVAIVNLFFSALGVLAALGALFGGLFSSLATGSLIGMIAGTVVSLLMAVIIGVLSVFGLIAGFGLLNHQPWARNTMIVVSAFRLFRWPFGTLFAAYSLWVLFHDDTRAIFNGHGG